MDDKTETDNKHSVENEFAEFEAKKSWLVAFLAVRNVCAEFEYKRNEAKKIENRNLNRYRDVTPYDHSRIILSRGQCDYINANLVKVEKARRQYILTQGPLPTTTDHFWLMVWEQKCKAVVMLNRVTEKNVVKCHQYWPLGKHPGEDDVMDFPYVGLKVQHLSETEASYYTTRTLRLTDVESGESREVLHFHYMTWPDYNVPQSPTDFLHFLAEVRQSGALEPDVGPAVVHCSAGIGRSGTFCLVDSCLVIMDEYGPDSVSVREVMLEMRRYRMGLVQTPEQLKFSYRAIIKGHKDGLASEDENNVENGVDSESSLNHIDDSPPPPPPRGESLGRSQTSSITDSLPSSPSSEDLSSEAQTAPVATDRSEPLNTDSLSNSGDTDSLSEPPSRPLPEVPSEPGSSSDDADEASCDTFPSSPESNTNESGDGPRQRRKADREERNARLKEQLAGLKRKQKQADEWQQLKRSIFQPLNIGLGVLILGGGVLAYSYYTNRL